MTSPAEQQVPTAHTYRDVAPSWPDPPRRAGRPDVVVIVLDDVGYGQLGCYGSSIDTPHIDRMAQQGVRFSNFHVTTLCSPTRASLLTGRNHHCVGMGFLSGFDTGYDAYRGHVRSDAATVARMLQADGYGTYAVGKWHLTPTADMTPAGPFEHWPLGRGFDRYYGFLWGEEDHWSPQLWEDNHAVDPPRHEGYHLTDDLAARAERYLTEHVSSTPDRPYLLYLALGAGHAPHQAPREYIDAYAGRFDHGWDRERELVLARQIEAGLVPPDTQLPPANPDVAAWADLSDDERRLAARMQEVFAGYLTHADAAIGRVIAAIESAGRLDDTLVIILSDNGASGQGGAHGTANEYRHLVGIPDTFEQNLAAIDLLGGPETHGLYPAGWAQAGNTPQRYYKKYNYAGGVRTPLIVHHPRRGAPAGVRRQFHHVIDVVPTILDACAVMAQDEYDGIAQQPLHGESFAPTLDAPERTARHRAQYFEMAGHRGIWCDGWKALTNHRIGDDYTTEAWQLFHAEEDFAEARDLAAQRPDVLARLQRQWWEEAVRYGVLPLDDRFQQRATDRGPAAFRSRFRLAAGTRLFSPVSGPNFADRSFSISAELEPGRPRHGVVLSYGRRAAGFSFHLVDGELTLDYNRAGEHTIVRAPGAVPAGRCRVALRLERRERGRAEAALLIDGEVAASREIATLLGGFGGLSVQVGHSGPSSPSAMYEPPHALPGLGWVDILFDSAAAAATVEAELAHE